MFSEIMKKGVLFLPEPHYGPGATPYWFFCFDYHAFLAGFAAMPGRQLFVHDYEDLDPYPDWRIVRVKDVATGQDLVDEVRWVKFSALDWAKDGSGFYYSRFPEQIGRASCRERGCKYV